MLARDRLVGRVLRHQAAGDGIEGLAVVVGPPVAEPSVAVQLAALVVEAVADLVADHRADRTVVDRVVGRHVEERRLQDRGREHDLVHVAVVVRVDRLRRHAPLAAVDLGADAHDLAPVLEGIAAIGIAQGVAGSHDERRVVAPDIGIADLDAVLGQLRVRLLLGGGRHPREAVDRGRVGLHQVGDQRLHARAIRGREVLRHVELADGLAECAVGLRDALLPARLLLLEAGDGDVVELVARVAERRRQHGGGAVEAARLQVQLPRVQRLGLHETRQRRDVVRLAHDDDAAGLQLRLRLEHGPVESGRQRLEFGRRLRVVRELRIARLVARPLRRGDLGLQRDHLGGMRGAVGVAGQREQSGQVVRIRRARLREALVALQVVVTIGQAQAALAEVGDVDRRVVEIGVGVDQQRRAHHALPVAHQADQHAGVLDAVHVLERGRDRVQAGLVDRGFVEIGAEVVVDLLRVGVRRRIPGLQAFDQVAHLVVGAIPQFVERAPGRLVGRDLGVLDPGAVHRQEQVVLRAHGLVHARAIDARAQLGGVGGLGHRRGGGRRLREGGDGAGQRNGGGKRGETEMGGGHRKSSFKKTQGKEPWARPAVTTGGCGRPGPSTSRRRASWRRPRGSRRC